MAGGKMDLSRLALEGGDTGKDTRVVQREAVALLEALIRQQSSRMSAMGLTGQRMMAMMQMMMMGGATPGGNPGGENAPILPAEVGRVDDQDWRKTHSRFEDQLGADFETAWPSEFRGLLEAYFDRLRKEPAR
jgi:hypothetical protein